MQATYDSSLHCAEKKTDKSFHFNKRILSKTVFEYLHSGFNLKNLITII